MQAVKNLDIRRYMGRWYEIASFPSRFQPRDGINTRATYSLNEDGKINVVNETWCDGKRAYIHGSAYKVNPSSNVKFYVPPFFPIIPVVGHYWVLHISDDYRYALIGQPSRQYLWMLCRQNHMDDKILKQLVQKAKGEGYDVSKLKKTLQTEPPPEEEDTAFPEDTKRNLVD